MFMLYGLLANQESDKSSVKLLGTCSIVSNATINKFAHCIDVAIKIPKDKVTRTQLPARQCLVYCLYSPTWLGCDFNAC